MEKIYACNICNKNYKNYHCLWNHKKLFHVEIINNIDIKDIKDKIICEFCNKIFNTRQAKSMHKKKCNEKIIFIEKQNEELKISQLKKELTEIKLKTQIEKAKKEFTNITSSIIQNNNQTQPIQETTKNGGHIYLIHEREFMNAKQNIYKIGRTKDINQRVKAYPKDSKLCFTRWSPNVEQYEKDLIEIFKMNFINKKEIGSEYFEGDELLMIKQMNIYFDENYNK